MDHGQTTSSIKASESRSSDSDQDQDRDGGRREVVVKIDGEHIVRVSGNSSTVNTPPAAGAVPAKSRSGSRESFRFKNRPPESLPSPTMSVGSEDGDDPPSRLIGNFLRKQAEAGREFSLDPDIEMEYTGKPPRPPASITGSRELRASSQDPQSCFSSSPSSAFTSTSDAIDNRSQAANAEDTSQVIRCTSKSIGSSLLHRSRTRSRLMDPPPPSNGTASAEGERNDGKSFVMKGPPMSAQLRSGLIGKSGPVGKPDDDDDDPFLDERLPADFKRGTVDNLIILEWVGLVVTVASIVCSLAIPSLSRKKLSGLPLWKWELLACVLICGRLVSGWLIRVAVFFVERNFLLRKKVLYFVYGVRGAVRSVLWLGVALISWHLLYDTDSRRESTLVLPYVTKVLCCLLVATVIRLVKTLLIKVLASSFHVSTYFDRIQDALFNQYVIETLSRPPLVTDSRMLAEVQKLDGAEVAMPGKSSPVPKSGRLTAAPLRQGVSGQKPERHYDEGISIDQLHRLSQKNISAWSMKRLVRIVRYGALTTMDEQIMHATGQNDEMATQIHSEQEARVAAKRIFHNVAKPGSKHIYLSDLMRFMRQEEAVKAMDLFEGAQEHKRVSKRSLKNWVVTAFRERKALALTLNDTKTAVNKLHQMADVVVWIVVLSLWLLILEITTSRFFVFLSSQLLVTVFIFGNTLKTIFEAIIFLFVMHPFDVGDRCEVEGMQVIVEEMNIMTTIFLRYDNLKIYYPNSQLAALSIMNYYRSPDMGDAVDFSVHVATPLEKLALMKERLLNYFDSKKEHWYPGSMVVLRDIDDMNRLKVSIWCRHTINFQDMGERFQRRELILQEMMKILRDLDIEYRMLALDINVRNAPPIQSTRMPTTWTSNY